MIYLTGSLVQYITINQLQRVLSPRRMQSQIDKLKGHVVVCGFGRMGQMLTRALNSGGARFVVLERNPQRAALARDQGYPCLEVDATEEAALKSAGVERARALATVLPDDAANVFITLSARNLNRDMEIIARGEAPSTENKLLHAGANRVVLPTHIGAERIAEMILFPGATGLVGGSANARDFESTLDTLGLRMETVVASEEGGLAGRTIESVERQVSGSFLVVQLNRRHGETVRQPSGETRIEAGDGVVMIGRSGIAGLFEADAG
jgi:voltage-gated potassium channel Kch